VGLLFFFFAYVKITICLLSVICYRENVNISRGQDMSASLSDNVKRLVLNGQFDISYYCLQYRPIG